MSDQFHMLWSCWKCVSGSEWFSNGPPSTFSGGVEIFIFALLKCFALSPTSDWGAIWTWREWNNQRTNFDAFFFNTGWNLRLRVYRSVFLTIILISFFKISLLWIITNGTSFKKWKHKIKQGNFEEHSSVRWCSSRCVWNPTNNQICKWHFCIIFKINYKKFAIYKKNKNHCSPNNWDENRKICQCNYWQGCCVHQVDECVIVRCWPKIQTRLKDWHKKDDNSVHWKCKMQLTYCTNIFSQLNFHGRMINLL